MTLKQTTIGEHSGKAPEEQAHSKSFAYSGLAQTMLAFWSAAVPSAAFGWASATKIRSHKAFGACEGVRAKHLILASKSSSCLLSFLPYILLFVISHALC